MNARVRVTAPGGPLAGVVSVPGDKSIAHRALLFGALARGRTTVTGFPGGADVLSTLDAITRLGARTVREDSRVIIDGVGDDLARGPRPISLDCGNSGTTMRLGAGLVAGGGAVVTLDGDASLRRRPMERVAAPLRAMGARVDTTDGHAPLVVTGGDLSAIDWTLPVASAQLKSAVLLAGLRARGTTRVREPLASRDHTERLLGHFGAVVRREDAAVVVEGGQALRAANVECPGDVSSAAFPLVAALIVPGSTVEIRGVGLNPTRTGVLDVLRRMGACITVRPGPDRAGEPCGDLIVRGGALVGTTIGPHEIPATIDELPILAIAAAFATGTTTIAGAGELRVKESDRLAALGQLARLGVPVTPTADGLVIVGSEGRPLGGASIDSHGDHRIAMAFAVAGLGSMRGVEIADAGSVAVSFPGFFPLLTELGGQVERLE